MDPDGIQIVVIGDEVRRGLSLRRGRKRENSEEERGKRLTRWCHANIIKYGPNTGVGTEVGTISPRQLKRKVPKTLDINSISF